MASAKIEQASLDELVKQVQSEAHARVVTNQQGQVRVLGGLTTNVTTYLNKHAEKTWYGNTDLRFPSVLTPVPPRVFEQSSRTERGVKLAVVYSGSNNAGTHQCGWLIAWSNPPNRQAKTVYVECGPIENYNNINWDRIKDKLDKSQTSSTSDSNAATGTSVFCHLQFTDDPTSSDGVLVAGFHGRTTWQLLYSTTNKIKE